MRKPTGSNPVTGSSNLSAPAKIGGIVAHPHPDRQHVMITYRRYILGEKRKAGGRDPRAFRRGARSLLHYRDYVDEYLEAKRDVLRLRSSCG